MHVRIKQNSWKRFREKVTVTKVEALTDENENEIRGYVVDTK